MKNVPSLAIAPKDLGLRLWQDTNLSNPTPIPPGLSIHDCIMKYSK